MATTDIAVALPVKAVRMKLLQGVEGPTGNARLLRPGLWMATVSTAPLARAAFAALKALIDALDGGVHGFLLWDPSHLYPAADPTGSIVGSNAVKIRTVGGDGKSFSLKTLPAGYVLTPGDLIQVTVGTRTALHRLVSGAVVADGSGNTAEFEVRPSVKAGMAANDAVNLKKPAAEMILVPGSLSTPVDGLTGRISFQAIQRR